MGYAGESGFSGNSKYLFLWVSNSANDVHPVWISRDTDVVAELQSRGYSAYAARSAPGIYYNLRARWIFVTHYTSDVMWWCCGQARVVNLWHGVPLKRIEWDTEEFDSYSLFRKLGTKYLLERISVLTVTSKNLQDIFASAFRLPTRKVKSTGYPRNDVLVRTIPDTDIGTTDINSEFWESDFTFAYVPTWRTYASNPVDTGAVDLDLLDRRLEEVNATLLLKLHPWSKLDEKPESLSNVFLAGEGKDLYPHLKDIDCLITDYSSIYFDFLQIGGDVVFYPYDRETYMRKRGFYFDYDKMTPGEKVGTFSELLEAIERVTAGDQSNDVDVARVRDYYFDHEPGGACRRIYNIVSSTS